MAMIRKRQGSHGPRWIVLYKDAVGVQRSGGTFSDELKAKERALEIERRQRQNRAGADQMLTAAYIGELWWPAYHVSERRKDLVRDTLHCAHGLVAEIGALPIGEVRRHHAGAWANRLRERGLAESTIGTYLGIGRMIFADAVEDRIIDFNPFAASSGSRRRRASGLHTTPKRRETYLVHEQATGLRAPGVVPAHARPILLLALNCGLRYGEAVAIRPRDIIGDPHDDGAVAGPARLRVDRQALEPKRDGHFVFTDPKWGSRRIIALDADTHAALIEHIRANNLGPDDLLCPSPGGGPGRARGSMAGVPWSNSRFRRDVWKPSLQRAGLDQVFTSPTLRFHDLRHTHATLLLAQGVPLEFVSHRLGHKSVAVTISTYSHVRRMIERGELRAEDLRGAEPGGLRLVR